MSSPTPRVSIGMPVYNGADHMAEALDSLLAQTFADFEVIVCDNASTDDTAEMARRYAERDGRVRYVRNETNLGAAGNFNKAFELSRGPYFKWMAHDDRLAPTYLERCVETLDSTPPSVVLCYPRRQYLTPDGEPIADDPFVVESARAVARGLHRITFARLVRVCDSRCPIMVFGLMRREAVARTRGMGNYTAADLIFVAEMRLQGELWEIPETLYFQRLHAATPDVLARMTRRGDAAWFDPANLRKRSSPEGRLLLEYLRAIHRSPVRGWNRAACYLALIGQMASRLSRWLVICGRRWQRCGWRMWSRMSLAVVRALRWTSWPLRCWALAAGLRSGDRSRLSMAMSRPWSGSTSDDLLCFAADRLSRRMDPEADRLLVDWLTTEDASRRKAAAQAMGMQPERYGPLVRDALHDRPEKVAVTPLISLFEHYADRATSERWTSMLSNGFVPAGRE